MSMSVFFKMVDAEKLEEFIQSECGESFEEFANENEIHSTDMGCVGSYLGPHLTMINDDCLTPEQVKQSVKAFEEKDWGSIIVSLLENELLGNESIEGELHGVISAVHEFLKYAAEADHAMVVYIA